MSPALRTGTRVAGSGRAAMTLSVGAVGGVSIRVSASCLLVVGLLAVALAPQAEAVAPELGGWGLAVGAALGVLVYVAALVHEAAHAVVARRFGHGVPSITLSALGGRTVVDGEARGPGEELVTAGVGPAASLGLGAVALGALTVVEQGLPALLLEGLVLANLVLGLLDLVPAPPLDGGRMVKAVAWAVIGSPRRGAIVAAWGGRAVAVLLVLAPLLRGPLAGSPPGLVDYLLAGALALLLWLAASSELSINRLRIRLGDLTLRDVARPAVLVPHDLPLAEAERRAGDSGAAGIVTVDATGGLLGLVSAAALDAVPAERRPWVSVATVTHDLVGSAGLVLDADLDGDRLLAAIHRRPEPAYLLLESSGALLGVLVLRDVDRAVRGP